MFNRVVARSFLPLLALTVRQPKGAAAIRAAQQRTLVRLVRRLAPLPIGRHFGLDTLPTDHRLPEAFAATVPITTYSDYAPLIDRVVRGERDVMFKGETLALAQTSGTTSAGQAGERYIPQSRALLDHHAKGGTAALVRLLRASGSSLLQGQLLMLGGSTALTPNGHGIPVGDLSGIAAQRIPGWLQSFYEPGLDIALDSDWERKLDRIAERCGNQDIRLASGIPSWLIMLFNRVCQRRGVTTISRAWPQLRGFIHGGHAITPFLSGLREHLSPDTWMMEVYPASEAFIGIGKRAWRLAEALAPELDLLCDHGIVLEFSPEDGGAIVPAHALEDGRLYRVLVSTPAGLLRYQIGDLVHGVGPGQIRIAGRIKARISVFGEHVEGTHLDQALAAACSAERAEVAYYHVAPILPHGSMMSGRHEWWVEFVRPPANLRAFTDTIDHHLRTHVIDYDAHRAGKQLLAPELVVAPTGTFHRYLAAAGKMGGQHKVPQAWNDRSIADALNRTAHGGN